METSWRFGRVGNWSIWPSEFNISNTLKLWRRVKRWRTGKTAIPCGNDEWRWEQMKLRRRECWRRKMYLILCFRSEGVNEALAPDSQRVIWGGLTLINPKLSPDSALQCVLQGSFRGGLFLSLILSMHTHTHTHTHWVEFLPVCWNASLSVEEHWKRWV